LKVDVNVMIQITAVFFSIQGFSFPEDVAYKIGPQDPLEYAVLEIHYDNNRKIDGACS